MSSQHSQYMQLAIKEAWKYQLLTYPNPAVGAVVVNDGEVLAVEAHKEAGKPHAEVLALQSAYLKKYPYSTLKDLETSQEIHEFLVEHHNGFFETCEIFITLEPCNHQGKTPPCAILLEMLKPKKVYIGSLDPNQEATGGFDRLSKTDIEIEQGVCKEHTDQLLEPFVIWQKKNFIFFKIAMREDGSVDGGYISSQESLNFVHTLRTKLDLLVIGGNTVRTDRPTLDARFAKQNIAPDILIYSHEVEFDKNIKLFNIEKREVYIEAHLNRLESKNFVMVEGGYSLLKNLKEDIDYLIVFISHKNKSEKQFDIESLGFEKIYSYCINEEDELVFLK